MYASNFKYRYRVEACSSPVVNSYLETCCSFIHSSESYPPSVETSAHSQ